MRAPSEALSSSPTPAATRERDSASSPGAREADRRRSVRDGDTTAYRPPQSPEDDHWLALGLKVATAMFLADLVARVCGFEDPTWSVITAAFLATNPPLGSLRSARNKVVALGVGIALGAAGASSAQALSGVSPLHFALVGLVVGALGTRSSDYLFAAVVGTIVTFAGTGGGDPLPEVITTTVCMVLIGCVAGPAVVWCVERARGLHAERGR